MCLCKFSNRVLIVRVEPLRLEPLLDLVAHGRDLLGGGVELAPGPLVLRLGQGPGVARVLGVSLGHGLGVRHQLRLRQGRGLTVSASNEKMSIQNKQIVCV